MDTQQAYQLALLRRFLRYIARLPEMVTEGWKQETGISAWTSLVYILAHIFDCAIAMGLVSCDGDQLIARYVFADNQIKKERLSGSKFFKTGLLRKILLSGEICVQDKNSEIDRQFALQGIESVLAVETGSSDVQAMLLCNRSLYPYERPDFDVPFLMHDKKLCRTLVRRFAVSDILLRGKELGLEGIADLTTTIGKNVLRSYLSEYTAPETMPQLLNAFIEETRSGIEVYFEPIISLICGSTLGYEVRVIDGRSKPSNPSIYLYREATILGEEAIKLLDLACIEKALAIASVHLDTGVQLLFLPVRYATFAEKDLLNLILNSEMPTQRIVLELVDTEAIQDFDEFRHVFKPLASLGISFAVSPRSWEFGTLLPQKIAETLGLKTHYIKVGRSFVSRLFDPSFSSLLRGIVEGGMQKNAVVIAESVEEQFEIPELINLKIPYAQGPILAGAVSTPNAECPETMKDFIMQLVRNREGVANNNENT